jgi:hypothetical protein
VRAPIVPEEARRSHGRLDPGRPAAPPNRSSQIATPATLPKLSRASEIHLDSPHFEQPKTVDK